MIARYMVLNETDKLLMVMRPSEVYAVEALVRQALETKNNGYIWRTTGERVIIVMGAVCAIKSRVSGTLNKYISCIA